MPATIPTAGDAAMTVAAQGTTSKVSFVTQNLLESIPSFKIKKGQV